MNVLYVLIPLALLLVTAAILAFRWATHQGQFDDLETPPVRVLFDDVSDSSPGRTGDSGSVSGIKDSADSRSTESK